jgi:hypothetical protein
MKTSAQRIARDRRQPVPGTPMTFACLKVVVGVLLIGRMLLPTESAADGDTIWMVQLWLAAGLLWAWHCYREHDYHLRVDLLDGLLWVIVAGHVISALAVVATEGHKRAAVNMLWEWVGLGVSFFLLRQTIRTAVDVRRVLLVLVTTTSVLAGLGLWQHYVFYPQTAAQYKQLRDELDRLENAPADQAARQRIRELHVEFASQEIPIQGPGRIAWESRLRSSTEPFGLFALANTFAGLLTAWLTVALGVLQRAWRPIRAQWFAVGLITASVILMAFCLLLTKSRTAWAGFCTGLIIWGWLAARANRSGHQKIGWAKFAVVVLVLGIGLAVAAASGGFDREVVSEAPKSLRYRLQYWSGTWDVLRERPILGTGPGNFRDHYLKYKAAESSEEIAEPHNFLLDIWTSGGCIALAGLLGLFVAAARHVRSKTNGRSTSEIAQTGNPFLNPLVFGGGLAFVVVYAVGWLLGPVADARLWVLLVLWVPLCWGLSRQILNTEVSEICLMAAAVALLVHLLGAGGIEMPAVSQTLLILLALGTVSLDGREMADPPGSHRLIGLLSGLLLLAAILCWFSATGPIMNRKAFTASGDFAIIEHGNVTNAERKYLRAVDADPLAPDPLIRLAELSFRRWEADERRESREFDRAVAYLERGIALNPRDANGYLKLGVWYAKRFEGDADPAYAHAASKMMYEAAKRYPNDAAIRSELAVALSLAGPQGDARNEAKRALELDAINRREGHRDRYLQAEQIRQLRQIDAGQPLVSPTER